jgi:hypothetical protein
MCQFTFDWTERLMKTIFQVLVGAALCLAMAVGLVYGPSPVFWEHEDQLQPHVYSITWRSAALFLLLVILTQWIAHLLFRYIGRCRKQNPGASDQGLWP